MDMLTFAIDMELEGERYYLEQAARNADNALRAVFEQLAQDEARHAKLLTDKQDGKTYVLAGRDKPLTVNNVFAGVGDYEATVKTLPDQPELYKAAMAMEQKSIDLYTDLRDQAGNEATVALFGFLIGEETEHYRILEEFYHYINRPKEWVESAEFGVREEY